MTSRLASSWLPWKIKRHISIELRNQPNAACGWNATARGQAVANGKNKNKNVAEVLAGTHSRR